LFFPSTFHLSLQTFWLGVDYVAFIAIYLATASVLYILLDYVKGR
jgi:hypothetical protein